jgi:hypothetical protein
MTQGCTQEQPRSIFVAYVEANSGIPQSHFKQYLLPKHSKSPKKSGDDHHLPIFSILCLYFSIIFPYFPNISQIFFPSFFPLFPMIFPTFFQRFDVESLCSSSGAFAALRRDGAVRCWGDAALGGHGEAETATALVATLGAFAVLRLRWGGWGSIDF